MTGRLATGRFRRSDRPARRLALIGLRILPAATALIAMPAEAAVPWSGAMPGRSWQQICGGDGEHWLLLPDPARPVDTPPDDRVHGGCAHALCSRERRVGDKGRELA